MSHFLSLVQKKSMTIGDGTFLVGKRERGKWLLLVRNVTACVADRYCQYWVRVRWCEQCDWSARGPTQCPPTTLNGWLRNFSPTFWRLAGTFVGRRSSARCSSIQSVPHRKHITSPSSYGRPSRSPEICLMSLHPTDAGRVRHRAAVLPATLCHVGAGLNTDMSRLFAKGTRLVTSQRTCQKLKTAS
jgi:hypothetical protein